MLCEKCGKNPATVMYTQIVNGKKSSVNICSHCAAQESIFDNFGSLLSFNHRGGNSIVCPVCATTLEEFNRAGRAGCGKCYDTFRKYADAMLKKIHGTSQHCEENIQTAERSTVHVEEKAKNEVDELKEKMAEAIAAENFEEAARLRDIIRGKEQL